MEILPNVLQGLFMVAAIVFVVVRVVNYAYAKDDWAPTTVEDAPFARRLNWLWQCHGHYITDFLTGVKVIGIALGWMVFVMGILGALGASVGVFLVDSFQVLAGVEGAYISWWSVPVPVGLCMWFVYVVGRDCRK